MLVCALAVGLAGCGSSDDDQKVSTSIKPSATAEESTAPETEASAEPEVEDELSQRAALDAYVEQERAALQATDPQLLETYSEITVEGVEPATIVFTYSFVDQIDTAAAVEQFEVVAAELQTVCDNQVFPAMESVGVTGSPQVTYTYLNADGTQIWTRTFEPS